MLFLKAVFQIGFSQILGIYINLRYFTDMAKQMDMAWGNKAKSKSPCTYQTDPAHFWPRIVVLESNLGHEHSVEHIEQQGQRAAEELNNLLQWHLVVNCATLVLS